MHGMLFDSHAHLDDPRFAEDLEAVLERARAAGVARIATVGAGIASSERAIALAAAHPGFLIATAGVHPHEARLLDDGAQTALRAWASGGAVAAVGETGLDYHYDSSPRPAQREAFAWHCDLAQATGLPLVVHCREAFDDGLGIMREYGGRVRGVAHCFTGGWPEARRFLDLGFFVSFSGLVTFPKMRALREVAARVPLDRLLVETDCPYLAPEGRRGRRNEPAWVASVAKALAGEFSVSCEELAERTCRNAIHLYGLGQ